MTALKDLRNPELLTGLIVAVALLSLALVVTISLVIFKISELRREWKAIRKSLPPRTSPPDPKSGVEECLRKIATLAAQTEELRLQMEALGRGGVQAGAPAWASESAPLQLNRRGQILRLADKGKSAAEIASDLGVSKGEVELLLKVRDLGPGGTEAGASRTVF